MNRRGQTNVRQVREGAEIGKSKPQLDARPGDSGIYRRNLAPVSAIRPTGRWMLIETTELDPKIN
jgi:hypothetical protein